MSYKPESDTVKAHRAKILDNALRLAETKPYHKITRDDLAAACGCATGVINAAFGTMGQLKRDIMRHAIKTNRLRIIADGLAMRDEHAQKASPEQKKAAGELLFG